MVEDCVFKASCPWWVDKAQRHIQYGQRTICTITICTKFSQYEYETGNSLVFTFIINMCPCIVSIPRIF